jgi:hypothetical protein
VQLEFQLYEVVSVAIETVLLKPGFGSVECQSFLLRNGQQGDASHGKRNCESANVGPEGDRGNAQRLRQQAKQGLFGDPRASRYLRWLPRRRRRVWTKWN